MDKIYRRSTQVSNTPKKKKNEKNRRRNIIMNFRVSPKEKELIDARIALSGLPRGKFFIESCMYQKILVKGNIKSFSKMKAKMEEVEIALKKDCNLTELDPELRESVRIILEILEKIFRKE